MLEAGEGVGRREQGGRLSGRLAAGWFFGADRFGDGVEAIDGKFGKRLRLTAGPIDGELVDLLGVAEAEVDRGVAGGHEAFGEREIAGLELLTDPQSHRRADAPRVADRAFKADANGIAFGTVVAGDRDHFLEVVDYEVEIAIAIEIAKRRAERDALFIEAPFVAHVFEVEVAHVLEGEVSFAERGFVVEEGVEGVRVLGPKFEGIGLQVAVAPVAAHAVGYVHIDPTILIEIDEAGRPGPVGAIETGDVGGL